MTPEMDYPTTQPRRLTLEETPAYAAKLFLLTCGREATPEELSKLHLSNPPYRECDLLSNVQGWLRHLSDVPVYQAPVEPTIEEDLGW